MRERVASLHNAFGGRFAISYAMKANPNAALLRRMSTIVPALDVSSGGELQRALTLGWTPRDISFTGPAKRPAELSLAVQSKIGAVVVESVREANELNDLAQAAGTRQTILLRLSPTKVPPGFGSRMAGRPSQFGVDEEDADAAVSSMLRPATRGARRPSHLLRNAVPERRGDRPELPILRGPIHSPLRSSSSPCKEADLRFGSRDPLPRPGPAHSILSALATIAAPALDALRVQSFTQDAEYILETGRYLVGEAGVYLTRVVSTKRSRGVEIRICDGGMNHHLGAAGHLGSVLHRNYRMFKLAGAENEAPIAQDLFGPLCTSIDVLAKSIQLPSLSVGDIVCILCSGAYGPTASPAGFISHDAAKEVLVERLEGRTCILDAPVV